jgi:hypothetical protein
MGVNPTVKELAFITFAFLLGARIGLAVRGRLFCDVLCVCGCDCGDGGVSTGVLISAGVDVVMAFPAHSRIVCSECGWKNPADLQTDETTKEFWCFHCGKMMLPRVISLRMTPAQRRLKGAFYIGIAVFIIAVLALALR